MPVTTEGQVVKATPTVVDITPASNKPTVIDITAPKNATIDVTPLSGKKDSDKLKSETKDPPKPIEVVTKPKRAIHLEKEIKRKQHELKSIEETPLE